MATRTLTYDLSFNISKKRLMIILIGIQKKSKDAEVDASSGQERNIIVQFYSENFCSSRLYKKLIKGDWVIKLDIIT